ncbi:MAG: SHD1 domain-containing protein, partial [Thermoguttaceae bacterium]|nr:SHD1 domain-containing protein [Thermoguttaceae bacterium]
QMMKRSILVLIAFFGIGFVSTLSAQTRTWSDMSGHFTVEATFVSFAEDAKTATLKKEDGTTIVVPFDKLSKADQEYIAKRSPKSVEGDTSKASSGLPPGTGEKKSPSAAATSPVVTVTFPADKGAIPARRDPFELRCHFDSKPTESDVKLIRSWQTAFDIHRISCFLGYECDEDTFGKLKQIHPIHECHFSKGLAATIQDAFLIDNFDKLETIEIGRGILPVNLFSSIGKLPMLRTLVLNPISMEYEKFEQLRNSKSLKDLSIISDGAVSERSMEGLGALSRLETLRLQLPGLTAAGFIYLTDLTALKHLELVRTPIPPQYITHFRRLQQLRTLVLEESPGLKGESIEIIRALLPQCEIKLRRDKKNDSDEQASAADSPKSNAPSGTGNEARDAGDESKQQQRSAETSSKSSSSGSTSGSPFESEVEPANVSTSSWAGIHIGDSIEVIKKNYEILKSGKTPKSDRMLYLIKPKQRKYSEIAVVCHEDRCISILVSFTANTAETYELLYRIHEKRFPSYMPNRQKTVQGDEASATFTATENEVELAIVISYEKTPFKAAQVSVLCADKDEMLKGEYE